MRATSGVFYPKLDHVRALAAVLVFFWHSYHLSIPTSYVPPVFFLSILEEGWTGVALFMALSGYLFAKIVDGKEIFYGRFLWNRLVRLLPLLLIYISYFASFHQYSWLSFLKGFYNYSWPGAAWSIVAELHFYLIFPILLFVARRYGLTGVATALAVSVAMRFSFWLATDQVHVLSYWTIGGRIDQFICGIGAFYLSRNARFARNAKFNLIIAFLALAVFWHQLNAMGGFYDLGGPPPSHSGWWVVIPAIEGLAWSCMVAAYDVSEIKLPQFLDQLLVRIGTVSYSIYLWHFPFLIDFAGKWISYPKDPFMAGLFAFTLFVPMVIFGLLSYEIIERPFLKFRVSYIKNSGV